MPDPLHTITETMALLHVSRTTLYRERRTGRLRVTMVRGSLRIRESEIQRYLRDGERRPGRAA
jgi:excisionase family DNA binding protein